MVDKASEILAPVSGAIDSLTDPGGLRFAATIGYYLPALRADTRWPMIAWTLFKVESANEK
jgi:hypothetical protein